MEQRIDRTIWRRNAHDQLFARLEVPFYSLTWRLDVTEALTYAKAHGISFYATMIWVTMRAVNRVEAFRYELRGEDVYLLELASKCKKTFPRKAQAVIDRANMLIDRNVNQKILFCDMVDRLFLMI